MSFWTPPRLERLKELAGQGLSATRIAGSLASEFREPVSRNAVIGKLMRGKGRYGKLAMPSGVRFIGAGNERPARGTARAGRAGAASPSNAAAVGALPKNLHVGARPAPLLDTDEGGPGLRLPVGRSPSPSRPPAVPAGGSTPLPLKGVEDRVENLPAPLPIGFFEAVERGLCLHFVGDPLGPGGPDMPVCGAERAAGASVQNRYCARHRASAAGAGTTWERHAEATLAREARHG